MYSEYYGLTGKPFQLSPDARFFFNSKGHNRAMAYLRYGLEQGEGFIVITGGIGTGKTMLVRNLFNELDTDSVVAAQLVSTQVNPEDMLRIVSSAYGLQHDDLPKATLLRNLEAFFTARRAEGKRVLLVVDEAQNLPADTLEELRMLSNYHDNGEALLQSFLLGQIQLKHKLQAAGMEQFRQRIIAGYHLQPLEAEETRQYVEYRLLQVGWKDDPLISHDAFERIHHATAGVPRRINRLCDRMMLFGCLEQLHEIERSHVESVVEEIAHELGTAGNGNDGAQETIFAQPGSGDDWALQTLPGVSPMATAPGVGAGSAEVQELARRLEAVERELESMKKAMKRDRQILKAALFDHDGDDDAEA